MVDIMLKNVGLQTYSLKPLEYYQKNMEPVSTV